MSKEYFVPEGNTDEAVEFLERMFHDQPRHLIAIPFKERLEASTFTAGWDQEMRAWIDVHQREDNMFFRVNGLRSNLRDKKATKGDVSTAFFITPLNRTIGRIILVAAVRRVREPGVKFDTIVVFEGKQGTGKSTALRILTGPGNHSDNELLTLDTKAQMEATEGVWIYELSEMSGLNQSEVERMKAFALRDVDRARMSYGRFSEARGRQTIFIGTTNEHKHLKDRTGNRRFLPVKTGMIDLVRRLGAACALSTRATFHVSTISERPRYWRSLRKAISGRWRN